MSKADLQRAYSPAHFRAPDISASWSDYTAKILLTICSISIVTKVITLAEVNHRNVKHWSKPGGQSAAMFVFLNSISLSCLFFMEVEFNWNSLTSVSANFTWNSHSSLWFWRSPSRQRWYSLWSQMWTVLMQVGDCFHMGPVFKHSHFFLGPKMSLVFIVYSIQPCNVK